jgi:MFS family permease
MCGSIWFPAAAAYLADVVPRELRTEGFGLWRVFQSGGLALGPPLGALLIWLVSIRAAFVFAGGAALAFVVILWRGLPESLVTTSGAARGGLRIALRDRALLALVLGGVAIGIAFGVYESGLPVFLHEERGMAIATWGLVYGISPLLVAVFQYPIARWAGARSSRGVLAFGAALHGVALALLWPFAGIGILVVAVVVFTLGEMLTVPLTSTMAAGLAPANLRGTYQGALTLAWEAGFGPGTFVGLWLIGVGHGETMLAATLPLALLGALCFLSLPRGRARATPALGSTD